MAPPRVALVHDQLLLNAGSESVFREISGMYEGDVICSVFDAKTISWLDSTRVRQTVLARLPRAKQRHYFYSPIMFDVWRKVNLRKYDVVLCDSHSFAHACRPRPDAVRFCYYYTPARALWLPEIDPRASSGRLATVKKAFARRMKPMDFRAAQHWDARYAISKTSAARIEKFYRQPCDGVIYPGVDVEKFADVRRTDDSEGLLFWSRLIEYKKVELVIGAAEKLGLKVNIVGTGPHEATLKEFARGKPFVNFHGRLPDEDLKRLAERSKAVVFPAYEDFGIVPVEAMAAGVPVIVYREGGAAETVRPEDGAVFDEQTVDSVADAIRRLDGIRYDSESTRAHAASFSQDRFRREYREAVARTVEGKLGRSLELPLLG